MIENDFQGFPRTPLENIQITLAHEFNHAIQFGYDALEPAGWRWEATATWIEDEAYDEVNDNVGYLRDYFGDPDRCLSNRQGYSDWIFLRYLSEHYGGQATVRRIWEQAVFSNGFTAIAGALSPLGTTIPEVFNGMAVANATRLTCPNGTPHCYREAWRYPTVQIEGTILFSGTTRTYIPSDGVQTNYSTDYVRIVADSPIAVQFTGSAGVQYGVSLLAYGNGGVTVLPLSLDGSPPQGTQTVDASRYDDLLLVIANLSQSAFCTAKDYTITVAPARTCRDLNNDLRVDGQDLQALARDWRKVSPYDQDGDSRITIRDVQMVAQEWGICSYVP